MAPLNSAYLAMESCTRIEQREFNKKQTARACLLYSYLGEPRIQMRTTTKYFSSLNGTSSDCFHCISWPSVKHITQSTIHHNLITFTF